MRTTVYPLESLPPSILPLPQPNSLVGALAKRNKAWGAGGFATTSYTCVLGGKAHVLETEWQTLPSLDVDAVGDECPLPLPLPPFPL